MRLPGHTEALVAGVDEAGRGPLAGGVVAAAVILDPAFSALTLDDSKKLTASHREQLYEHITSQARCYAVGRASVEEIDRLNILRASLLAMERALDGLTVEPQRIYVDGAHSPAVAGAVDAVPRGDGLLISVAAASIIAKVERDRDMFALDQRFPGYGFARHKGYPTRAHLEALDVSGPCVAHRRSFAPVARRLPGY